MQVIAIIEGYVSLRPGWDIASQEMVPKTTLSGKALELCIHAKRCMAHPPAYTRLERIVSAEDPA